MNIKKLSPLNHKYLQILGNIAKCPEKLYFIGSLPENRIPTIAIIGSRKPTSYGREVTYKLAHDLAQKGVIVVSGLALGVDAIAHRAALDAGGTTIAVLANSVDKICPATNKSLAEDILKYGGAILSEYEPPTDVMKFRLLQRNRIVSGLSDAVIVTEAAARSGVLSTVMHALEQGREVFVVPGNITSPMSAGCNKLIKQGAHPVTCANDVLEVIAPDILESQTCLALGANPSETRLIELLQSGIRDGDELQTKSGMEVRDYLNAITMMEIAGTIRALGGNQWTLK
ncbi:DNA-protecting protein DprA [Candidatus Saccharibacteria bacterium]|nr:DNA-protecting protein DprA [Candidatus Saccharibacteria bacterium]